MYADNTLTPKEAIRLSALGTLAQHGALRYSTLARQTRHFIDRMLGPSLDLMGTSIELLKYEGLVRPVAGQGMEDDALLEITANGRRELDTLLTARLRAGASELNKLLMALKFRFLHLLDGNAQRTQIEMLAETCESELARLIDLRGHHAGDKGQLVRWLDHDIDQLEARIAWLGDFRARLSAGR